MVSTVEDIVDILGKMQVEDAKSTDILRAYFTELKKSLDEKNSFAMEKFEDLKQTFDVLVNNQADLSKTEELKVLFDVFQEHVNVIANDMKEQQTALNSIEEKLQNLSAEKPDKKEFLESFDVVKDLIFASIEKFDAYNEYTKSSMENITERLNSLVTKDDNTDLKILVEDLVKKSNDTIEALRFFNEKSEVLANAIQDMIASENYIQSHEKINTILDKTSELSLQFQYLPLKTDVENISEKITEISNLYNEKINEINSNIELNLKSLSEITLGENENTKAMLQDKFMELQMVVASNSHTFGQKIDDFKTKMAECINSVTVIAEGNIQKVNMSATEISDIKQELVDIINIINSISPKVEEKSGQVMAVVSENLSELTSELETIKSNIATCINTTNIQDSLDFVSYRFDEIGKSFSDLKNDIDESDKNIIVDISEKIVGLKQEINLVNTDIAEIANSKNIEIIQAISDLKQDLTDLLAFDFSKNFDELKAQIEMSYLNVGTDITGAFSQNQELISALNTTYKELHTIMMSFDEFVKNDVQNNLDLMKLSIDGFEKEIKANLNKTSDFIDNWDNELEKIKNFTDGVKNDLSYKLEECCNELKSSEDESVDKTICEIQNLKGLIDENFSEVADSFASVIECQKDKTQESEIIKNEVTYLGETLKDFVTTACENSLKKVDETIHNINAIGTMVDNNDEIVSIIDNIKTVLADEITKKLNVYAFEQDTKLEKIKADINSYVYTEQIEDEKAKILDEIFAVKEKSQNNQQIMNIVETLEKRVNSINAKNPVNDYVKSLSEINKKAIFEELHNIKDELEFCLTESQSSLNDLTDILSDVKDNVDASSEKFSNISEKLENLALSDSHLAQTLEALHSKVDILALGAGDDDFDISGEIDDIKGLIINQIEELKTSEQNSNIKYMDECFNKLLEDMNSIKDDVPNKDVKDSVISAIVSVFDQVSFIEETEEIKDFVEEKTDEINEKLKEVRDQLQLITTGENTDYTYTLQDVESDIAKLRLAMKEVTNSAPQQTLIELRDNIEHVVSSVENIQSSLTDDEIIGLKNDFTKLSEDMVSISSRTNKLLLTSDESYKALSDGLDRFGGLIYKLEDKIQFPDTTEINERIEKKVDALSVVVNNSVANDEIFHQVLQYLGEWMDSVSESINSISEKTSEVSKIKDITEELKFLMPQKTEIIEELEHRFEAQELRIDRLEMKLDNILLAIEEKSDSLISKKLDKLEKQIAKLGLNVEKLASYVDEE